MSDLFWDVATSGLALGVLGVVLVAAFVLAHMPTIVERLWPEAYAYSKAAALVQLLAAAALFFLIGFRISDERAETRQLKNDLAWRESELADQKAVADQAARLKQQAEAEAEQARGELNDYREKYGDDPTSLCSWTADDLVRLRQLGKRPGAGDSATRPRLRIPRRASP